MVNYFTRQTTGIVSNHIYHKLCRAYGHIFYFYKDSTIKAFNLDFNTTTGILPWNPGIISMFLIDSQHLSQGGCTKAHWPLYRWVSETFFMFLCGQLRTSSILGVFLTPRSSICMKVINKIHKQVSVVVWLLVNGSLVGLTSNNNGLGWPSWPSYIFMSRVSGARHDTTGVSYFHITLIQCNLSFP